MFVHTVLWNVREELDRKEVVTKIRDLLHGLPPSISLIKSLYLAENQNEPSETQRDLMLRVEFAKREDYYVYKVHPAHQRVVDTIKNLVTDRIEIDYSK